MLTIHRTSRKRVPPSQHIPALSTSAHRFVKLGVRLLSEQRKGSQSQYHEWLKQLPHRVDSPVNWTPELVQQLQYPHLIHQVAEQQQEWSAFYDTLVNEGLVNRVAAPSKQVSRATAVVVAVDVAKYNIIHTTHPQPERPYTASTVCG